MTYTYDNVNRISTATNMGFTWDDGPDDWAYRYDPEDRLLTAGDTSYSWDPNGNMVGRYDGVDAWNYTYDPGNRLTAVLKEGVAQGRFWYDADGRRVRLWDVVDGFTDHVYSGLYVVYEENATIFTKHFYANGLHFAENRSGTVEFFHQDHLGSTRLKTNSTCGVVYDTNHVPFGPDQGEAGSEEFKYTGKQEDATGLYYYWARYYDPETGRFITEDLVKGILEDQQNLKRYVYCYYNP